METSYSDFVATTVDRSSAFAHTSAARVYDAFDTRLASASEQATSGTPSSQSYHDTFMSTTYQPFTAAVPYHVPILPFPFLQEYGAEPGFIRKRNERERLRVRNVNEGYARLRDHLPLEPTEKRLSKVETLRSAIQYIKYLEELLAENPLPEKRQKKQ